MQESVEMFREIIEAAEGCGHPPTKCSVFATIASEYLPFLGDVPETLRLSKMAIELADAYDLGHCK
jgi:hypothetical protein